MKFKYFKKCLFALLLLFSLVGLFACDKNPEAPSSESTTESTTESTIESTDETTSEVPSPSESTTPPDGGLIEDVSGDGYIARGVGLENAIVVFHYQRNNNDYDDWNIWVWDTDGVGIYPTNQNSFGVYYVIDLGDPEQDFYHSTKIGYIYRKGNWEEKDTVSIDRFVSLTESMLNERNEIHLYSFEGEETMYLDANMKNPIFEIKSVSLDSKAETITIKTNAKGKTYQLYKDDEMIKSGDIPSSSFTVVLPEKFNIVNGINYYVRIDFGSDIILEKELNINSYYDSADFKSNYIYNGNDLGVTLTSNSTTFKVWAPISSQVSVQLWNYGHATKYGTAAYPGDDNPIRTIDLVKGENGVWSQTVNENLTGKYYTYTVTNGATTTSDIVDPYARATGLNGMRGYIVDFEKINPDGWDYNYTRPYTASQLVVYELHVRDLTMDETWTGTEEYRGTYLGMAESGTTYTKNNVTVTTGFDHIKELGVNAVQILPFFDQANDERTDTFNWGYNPQNYNVLEGQYSTNPYDAEARIVEFKQMMMAYREAGIEVIMDVVYNHMSGITGSSFDKIVPGYFFRYTEAGDASNGSGCGNETASERAMFHNYMLDSTKFWVEEYNISGFRFDLMGLHDIETMNAIAAQLKEIDSNIVIYGEPWTGGTSTLASAKQATTANASKLVGVGVFNDSIRDGIKGSVFDQASGGWVQGSSAYKAQVVDSMDGLWKNDPLKQINYVSCHDNNTLADKLTLSGVSAENLADADIVAQGMVLTSEGISFFLSGEEFLRSKPIFDEEGNPTGEVSHNSYDLPDATNSLKWDEKVDNIEVFNKYKDLIAINRNHSIFQFATQGQCSNYSNLKAESSYIVNKVKLPGSLSGTDDWAYAMMIYSNGKELTNEYTVTGEWVVGFVSGNTTLKVGDTVSGKISFDKYTMIILYQPAE